MPSTKRTTILSRTSQCLAATTPTAGLAFGATPIASAAPGEWEVQDYLTYSGAREQGIVGA